MERFGTILRTELKTQKLLLATVTGMMLALAACTPKSNFSAATDAGGLLTTDDIENSQSIIGGEAVAEGDLIATSTVGIINVRYGQLICTGSLVSKNLVITAGHCTTEKPEDLAILFSAKVPKTRNEAAQLPTRKVIAGQTHPQWPKNDFSADKNWGDMALLRFDGDMPTGFAPIRLLSKLALLQVGTDTVLAGFGYTDGIKHTDAEGLNKTTVKIENPTFSDMELLLNQKEGRGACHGDSGGPAFIEIQGHLVLIGVTSRGYNDAADTCTEFAVYSSVATQMTWLKQAAVELQKQEAIGKPMPQPF